MRFKNYLNEKVKYTGLPNTDKILEQIDKWKSDLRKITKMYKSLEYPEDSKEIKKWKEVAKISNTFKENFYEWAFEFILNDAIKVDWKEQSLRKEFKKNAWTAYMNFNISDLFPEKYDRSINNFGWDIKKVLEKRKSIIDKYNRHFREAFKTLEKLLKEEEGWNKRIKQIQNFNYGGINIQIKGNTPKTLIKGTEEFLTRLKDFINKLKEKDLDNLTNDLRLVLNFLEESQGKSAEYNVANDTIVFYQWGIVADPEKTLYHELGHRLYDQFLTKKAKDNWNNFINNIKVKIKEEDINSFVNKFYDVLNNKDIKLDWSNDEWARYFLIINDIDVELIGKYQKLLFSFYQNVMGRDKNEYSKKEIKELLNNSFIGTRVNKYFITEYSNQNHLEAFAEVFKLYVKGKFNKLNHVVREIFKDIVNSSQKIELKEDISKLQKYLIKENNNENRRKNR